MKTYGLGAICFCFLITAIGLQWFLFTNSFFIQLMSGDDWINVTSNIYNLMYALFALAAVAISFGAVIGNISPLQIVVMTLIELFIHPMNNQVLLINKLNIVDIGSTYNVHMFGAYYGLAVSYVLGKPYRHPSEGYVADLLSFIGIIFLWIYWPSFVAGGANPNSDQQQRAVINTIFALCASTITVFCGSSLFNYGKSGKYRPVDIQNATLVILSNFMISCH
jgi:ammonium transporter Rh